MTLKVSNQIIPFLAKEGNLTWPLQKKMFYFSKVGGNGCSDLQRTEGRGLQHQKAEI